MPVMTSILRRRGALPLVVAGTLGRLPMGMVGLAMTLLVVAETGSYAVAGALTATLTLAAGLIGPLGSRLADRWGQAKALRLLLTLNTILTSAMVLSITAGYPRFIWFVLAALCGASSSNIGSMVRTRWMGIVRDPQERSAAFALESVIDESIFVAGPILASIIAVAISPLAAALVGVAGAVIGGVMLILQKGTEPAPAPHVAGVRKGTPLKVPGMLVMLAVMFLLGGVFGSFNVSTVAFAEQQAPGMSGLLLGAFSLGSLISGIILGLRRRTWTLPDQVGLGLVWLTLALALVPFADGVALYSAAAFLAGLSVSVVMVGAFGLVERLVPRGQLTEALTVSGSGIAIGLSFSLSASGAVIDAHGARLAVTMSAIAAAAAAGTFWASRRRLSGLFVDDMDADESGEVMQDVLQDVLHESAAASA